MRARNDAEWLLADLLRAGAIPVLEDGRLTIDAPPGCLTAARRERMAASLPELRAIVAARWRSREECITQRPCRRMSRCAEPNDGRPCLLPATCCECGAGLPVGHRYRCRACTDGNAPVDTQSGHSGDAQP